MLTPKGVTAHMLASFNNEGLASRHTEKAVHYIRWIESGYLFPISKYVLIPLCALLCQSYFNLINPGLFNAAFTDAAHMKVQYVPSNCWHKYLLQSISC
jgi:hypothetical protein